MHKSIILSWALTALAAAVSFNAAAIPVLQLGIDDGTYDNTTQTSVAPGPVFDLYAFYKNTPGDLVVPVETFFLSIALTPKSGPAAPIPSFGSFKIGATTYDFDDMIYGVPPAETFGDDPGDLSGHGIYDTLFLELGFVFSATDISLAFDVPTQPDAGPLPASLDPQDNMAFHLFDVDVSGLATGYGLHFDLYSSTICTNGQGQCGGTGDIDTDQFAPFSHDAMSSSGGSSGASSGSSGLVPEPGTLSLLGVGMLLAGFARLRRSQWAA